MFENKLIAVLHGFNRLLHVLLAVALVVASLMVMWEFTHEVVRSLRQGMLAQGFLHALGTLFIVWTLSSLISAEVNYIQTHRFHVRVFIEVALITLLRQLLVEPVQTAVGTANPQETFSVWHYGLLLAALLIVGVVHRLVGDAVMQSDERG